MRLAVMQPYLLPYLGYFQLMAAVDRFVLYDDVHFINRGWINRNRILLQGQEHLFTLPLQGASQNRRINEIELRDDPRWRDKIIRTIEHAYGKAPEFSHVYPLIRSILLFPALNLSDYLGNGLSEIKAHLEIETELIESSADFGNAELKGQERILDICRLTGTSHYINAPGGRELYSGEAFQECGVTLEFIEPEPFRYEQGNAEFVPSLSIVDVLMHNPKAVVREQLRRVSLRS